MGGGRLMAKFGSAPQIAFKKENKYKPMQSEEDDDIFYDLPEPKRKRERKPFFNELEIADLVFAVDTWIKAYQSKAVKSDQVKRTLARMERLKEKLEEM
jgi:hypothetical protein